MIDKKERKRLVTAAKVAAGPRRNQTNPNWENSDYEEGKWAV